MQGQVFDIGAQSVAHGRIDRVDLRSQGAGFDDHVTDVIHRVDVVAGSADQGIGADTTVQDVAVGVADQGVVEGVAKQTEDASTQQGNIFHVVQIALLQIDGAGLSCRIEGNGEGVITFVGQFLNECDLARLIDAVGIVTFTADHSVDAGTAVKDVIAVVACQEVVLTVADSKGAAGAGQGDVFNVGAQNIGDRGHDGIDFARQGAGFEDHITGMVDNVRVVAGATCQYVGAEAAVEDVVARVAKYLVVQCVAGTVEISTALQCQVLDIIGQGVVDRCVNRVDLPWRAIGLDDHIADIVDDVDIVASTTGHGVRARHAIEQVAQVVANQGVVERRTIGVFDFCPVSDGQPFVE
ncbi:hypothetical protein PS718_04097 [Pseudomonas fluorescens]|uniref:Uncharacterized protein n=1 Tax=Pseudomonas fluorescens TaxID=294 RepID=A0A5E7E2V7_PSEFL|nr:hypothetical protein PS718_04097 [Pseudomonas fluorescens]